ncbi:MAG: 50S ribosomal protein L19e [Candidatus Micrarchaeaceae archaeon]
MSIKFVRRAASYIMNRGESAIRIKPSALADAKKALTKEDVRDMIKKGNIYAIKKKKNISIYGKLLQEKRSEGRSRGPGRKRGTFKARAGETYAKKVRGQRRILKALKHDNTIDNQTFRKLYSLVKGGTFSSKVTLLHHIRSIGITIDDAKFEKLRHM